MVIFTDCIMPVLSLLLSRRGEEFARGCGAKVMGTFFALIVASTCPETAWIPKVLAWRCLVPIMKAA
jgi:hypothetical protein